MVPRESAMQRRKSRSRLDSLDIGFPFRGVGRRKDALLILEPKPQGGKFSGEDAKTKDECGTNVAEGPRALEGRALALDYFSPGGVAPGATASAWTSGDVPGALAASWIRRYFGGR